MIDSDLIITIKPLIVLFEKLAIPYYIGGSVASSAYGKARSTLDVDLVAPIPLDSVRFLTEELKDIFYVSEEGIIEAIQRSSSFNIVHLETMMKVDVFVLKTREYDQQAFTRKKVEHIDEENGEAVYYLSSPEDVILNKLEWFLTGGQVSERQWNDVIGVLKVQQDKLDKNYLTIWAKVLKIEGLLKKAFAASK